LNGPASERDAIDPNYTRRSAQEKLELGRNRGRRVSETPVRGSRVGTHRPPRGGAQTSTSNREATCPQRVPPTQAPLFPYEETIMPAFLKIDGVDGDSAHDDTYKKWIDVRSVGTVVHRTVPMTGNNAADFGKGTTSFSTINLNCKLDSSWPQLAKNCADGKKHGKAQIHLCRDENNKSVPYATIDLTNVIIADCNLAGSGSDDGEMLSVSLGFTEIKWAYNKTDGNGNSSGKVETTYVLMK